MLKTMTTETEMQFELLQPWSTFVMKTQLPPEILQKMLKIANEIVENRAYVQDQGAGEMQDQFYIDLKILEQEKVMEYFTAVCRNYVTQAFCQSQPFDKENILKLEWMTRLNSMWINSQKDNEYFPIHHHVACNLSTVMYLKIPEYLPSRKFYEYAENDGAIIFVNNTTQDKIWALPDLRVRPQVGDFFIFPASQQHLVYPFRTADGKGERRSVSFNASFTSKYEQDTF
jgi:uncharacterized protein (TIGR02466 family)